MPRQPIRLKTNKLRLAAVRHVVSRVSAAAAPGGRRPVGWTTSSEHRCANRIERAIASHSYRPPLSPPSVAITIIYRSLYVRRNTIVHRARGHRVPRKRLANNIPSHRRRGLVGGRRAARHPWVWVTRGQWRRRKGDRGAAFTSRDVDRLRATAHQHQCSRSSKGF